MYKLELLVVIVNYRTVELTFDCLRSLVPQLKPSQKVVIVDNDSRDGSVETIEEWVNMKSHEQKINVIASAKNLGFSGGNNIGINSCEASYYLLLNSDTIVRPEALQHLLQCAKSNSTAGIISPRLEWQDGTPQISCFKFHSPISELIHSASFSFITRLFTKWNIPIDVQSRDSYPEWTSFACVLIKRQVIEEIGQMDEGYFLYYEDVDYCLKAQRAGWKVFNTPSARVVHLRGGSSPAKEHSKHRKRLPRYVFESRARYFVKSYGIFGLLTANLLWHVGRAISVPLSLSGRKGATCEKEFRDIWTNFFNPLRKSSYLNDD